MFMLGELEYPYHIIHLCDHHLPHIRRFLSPRLMRQGEMAPYPPLLKFLKKSAVKQLPILTRGPV